MKGIMIAMGSVALIGLVAYLLYLGSHSVGNSALNLSPDPSVPPSPSPSVSGTADPSVTTPAPDVERPDVIPQTWRPYTSLGSRYEFWYPPTATVSATAENGQQIVTVTRLGDTQNQETEITDGYQLTIRLDSHTGQSFTDFVVDQQVVLVQTPTISSIQGTDSYETMYDSGRVIYVNGQPDRDFIYLPGPNMLYLQVVQLIQDPRDVQFGVEAGTIISTTRFRE